MSVHDWDAIRLEYVTGNMSLRELAAMHGIDDSLVMRRAAAEHWTEEREQTKGKARTKALDLATDDLAKLRYTALELTDAIVTKFMEQLANKRISAFDAVNAARFREVLLGGVSDRAASVSNESIESDIRALGLSVDDVVKAAEDLVSKKKALPDDASRADKVDDASEANGATGA